MMKPKNAALIRPEVTSPWVTKIDGVLEIDARREAEALGRHHEAAEHADGIADADQDRHGDDRCDQARHDEIFDRVGGEGGERVDLLVTRMVPISAAMAGGDAARDHQSGDDGAKLARDAQDHDLRHDGLGAVAVAAQIRFAKRARRR